MGEIKATGLVDEVIEVIDVAGVLDTEIEVATETEVAIKMGVATDMETEEDKKVAVGAETTSRLAEREMIETGCKEDTR